MWIKLLPWILYLHLFSGFTFFLAHGASVAMSLKLRTERDFTRLRAMLDLSSSTVMIMGISFLVMGITGLIMPFILKIWNKGWVWTSIVLILIVVIRMGMVSERNYKPLRRLVGLPYLVGGKQFPAEEPASQEDVEAHIKKMNVNELIVVGYVIPMFVLWLMVFKPF